jgi:hypothetical protein
MCCGGVFTSGEQDLQQIIHNIEPYQSSFTQLGYFYYIKLIYIVTNRNPVEEDNLPSTSIKLNVKC